MNIAIKSEMDSRPILYPLMRALFNYGSILVITNNKILKRLIDTPDDCGFRNITVLVDDCESADEICENYGIAPGDYDFVLIDNLGTAEWDACFIALGVASSEEFEADVEMLLETEEQKCCLLQFGQTVSKSRLHTSIKEEEETSEERKERIKKERAEKKQGSLKHNKSEAVEDYDPSKKFKDKVENKTAQVKAVKVSFPAYQDIEQLEAEHRFALVDRIIADAIYELLKDALAVEKIQFQKEVRKKDESSGYIKSRAVR